MAIEMLQFVFSVMLKNTCQGVLYENRGHTMIIGHSDADGQAHPLINVLHHGIVCSLEVT